MSTDNKEVKRSEYKKRKDYRKPCKYKHDYQLYSNLYKDGKPNIDGKDWVTELVCSKCDTRPPKEIEESLLIGSTLF